MNLPRHWTEHCYECQTPTDHIDTDEYVGCVPCRVTSSDVELWLRLWNPCESRKEQGT